MITPEKTNETKTSVLGKRRVMFGVFTLLAITALVATGALFSAKDAFAREPIAIGNFQEVDCTKPVSEFMWLAVGDNVSIQLANGDSMFVALIDSFDIGDDGRDLAIFGMTTPTDRDYHTYFRAGEGLYSNRKGPETQIYFVEVNTDDEALIEILRWE